MFPTSNKIPNKIGTPDLYCVTNSTSCLTDGAASFNGSNQYLSCVSNSGLQTGNVDFFVGFWMYASTVSPSYQGLYCKRSGGSVEFQVNLTGGILSVYNGAGEEGATISTGKWYFVLTWFDSSAGTINQTVNDNASITGVSFPASTVSSYPVNVGYDAAGNYFDGIIDSVVFGKPSTPIASLIPDISTYLYNNGKGNSAKSLSPAQIATWGVVSGWDFDNPNNIGLDSIGTNNLTNNNVATVVPGLVSSKCGNGDNVSQWLSNGNEVTSLVAHYPLDAATYAGVIDSSGIGDGTLVGGVTRVNDVPQALQFPLRGSLQFDGSTGYVSIGDSITPTLNGSFAISCWIKHINNSAIHTIIGNGGYSNSRWLAVDNGTLSTAEQGIAFINQLNFTAYEDIWTHVAWAYDSTAHTSILYVNGVSVSSASYTFASNYSYFYSISDSSYAFQGNISDVRIYNTALSAAEVSALAAGVDNRQNLVAYYPFSEQPSSPMTLVGPSISSIDVPLQLRHDGARSLAFVSNHVNAGSIPMSSSTSISCWISAGTWNYSGNAAALAGIVSKGQWGGDEEGDFRLVVISSGGNYLYASVYTSNGNFGASFNVSSFSVGAWYHLVGIYDESNHTVTLYINGVEQALTSTSGTMSNNSHSLEFGCYPNNESNTTFQGNIADVRIYNTALTSDEVLNLFLGNDVHNGLSFHYDFNSVTALNAATNNGVPSSAPTPSANTPLIAYDYSGNQNNGIGFGQPAVSKDIPQEIKAFSSRSLSFNGGTDYVQANLPALNNTSITLTAWVKISVNGVYVVYDQGSNTNGRILWYINSDNVLRLYTNTEYVASTKVINDGNWHHVAVVWNSSGVVAHYTDGVETGTGSVGTPTNINSYGPRIGIALDNGGPWDGNISDVRLYSRVLTSSEIAGLAGATVGQWELDEGSGTTAIDSSGNGNNGTIYGATYVADVPTVLAGNVYSLSFNGSAYVQTPTVNIATNSDFTISAWAKPALSSVGLGCVMRSAGSISIYQNGNSWGYYAGGGIGFIESPLPITANQWYLVTVSYTNSTETINLFVDGKLSTTTSCSQSISSQVWKIGDDDYTQAFNGRIADVRIYPYALSAWQVQSIFQGNTITANYGPTDALASYFNFSEQLVSSGKSLAFNGTSQYVDCGNNSSLSMDSNPRSVSAWVYIDSYGTYRPIIAKRSGSTVEYNYHIDNSGGDGYMASYNGTTSVGSTNPVPLNSWHHVAWVYSSGTIYFYLDGSANGSASQTAGSANNYNVYIGQDNGSSPNFFQGNLSDVRLYSRALTSGEVASLANGNLGPVDSLVGRWQLNESTLPSVKDVSGNNNNGVLVNGPVPSTDVPAQLTSISHSLAFDGSTTYITASDANLPAGDNPRSLCFWFKTESSDFRLALTYGDTSVGTESIYIGVSADGKIDLANNVSGLETSQSYNDGDWHQTTATFDGTTWTIYVDGLSQVSSSSITTNTVLSKLNIGGYDNGSYIWLGLLADIRIYDRALTPAEITQLYLGNDITNGLIALPIAQRPIFSAQQNKVVFNTPSNNFTPASLTGIQLYAESRPLQGTPQQYAYTPSVNSADAVGSWYENVSGQYALASSTGQVVDVDGLVSGSVRMTQFGTGIYYTLSKTITLSGEFTLHAVIDYAGSWSAVVGGVTGNSNIGFYNGDLYIQSDGGANIFGSSISNGLQTYIISRDSGGNVYYNGILQGNLPETLTINAIGTGDYANVSVVGSKTSMISIALTYMPTTNFTLYAEIQAALQNNINYGTPIPSSLIDQIPNLALFMTSAPLDTKAQYIAAPASINSPTIDSWLEQASGQLCYVPDAAHTATVVDVSGLTSGTVRGTQFGSGVYFSLTETFSVTTIWTVYGCASFGSPTGNLCLLGGNGVFLGWFGGTLYFNTAIVSAPTGLVRFRLRADGTNAYLSINGGAETSAAVSGLSVIDNVGARYNTGTWTTTNNYLGNLIFANGVDLFILNPSLDAEIQTALSALVNYGTPIPDTLIGKIPNLALFMSSELASETPQQFQHKWIGSTVQGSVQQFQEIFSVPNEVTISGKQPAVNLIDSWLDNATGKLCTVPDSSHEATVVYVDGVDSGKVRGTQFGTGIYFTFSPVVVESVDEATIYTAIYFGGNTDSDTVNILSGTSGASGTWIAFYANLIFLGSDQFDTPFLNPAGSFTGWQYVRFRINRTTGTFVKIGTSSERNIGTANTNTYTFSQIGINQSGSLSTQENDPIAAVIFALSDLSTTNPALDTAIQAALTAQMNYGTPIPSSLIPQIPNLALFLSSAPLDDNQPQQFYNAPIKTWLDNVSGDYMATSTDAAVVLAGNSNERLTEFGTSVYFALPETITPSTEWTLYGVADYPATNEIFLGSTSDGSAILLASGTFYVFDSADGIHGVAAPDFVGLARFRLRLNSGTGYLKINDNAELTFSFSETINLNTIGANSYNSQWTTVPNGIGALIFANTDTFTNYPDQDAAIRAYLAANYPDTNATQEYFNPTYICQDTLFTFHCLRFTDTSFCLFNGSGSNPMLWVDSNGNFVLNGNLSSGPYNDGLWHTVFCLVSATESKLWVDGVLIGTSGGSVVDGIVVTFFNISGGSTFTGEISEFGFYPNYVGDNNIKKLHFSLAKQFSPALLEPVLYLDASSESGNVYTDGSASFVASSNQFLSCGSNLSLRTTSDFWVCGWCNLDDLGYYYGLLSNNDPTSYNGFNVYATGGSLTFQISDTSSVVSVGSNLIGNTFFIVWFDSVAATINIKTNNQSTVTVSTSIVPTAGFTDFNVGSMRGGTYPFSGSLSSIVFGKPKKPIASVISDIQSFFYNNGEGNLAVNLTSTQIKNWGVASGWDFTDPTNIGKDYIGSNNLTNNNSVTQGTGIGSGPAEVGDMVSLVKGGMGTSINAVQATIANRGTLASSGLVFPATGTPYMNLTEDVVLDGDFTAYFTVAPIGVALWVIGNSSNSGSNKAYISIPHDSRVIYVVFDDNTYVGGESFLLSNQGLVRIRRVNGVLYAVWSGSSEILLGDSSKTMTLNALGIAQGDNYNGSAANLYEKWMIVPYDMVQNGTSSQFEEWASENGWGTL